MYSEQNSLLVAALNSNRQGFEPSTPRLQYHSPNRSVTVIADVIAVRELKRNSNFVVDLGDLLTHLRIYDLGIDTDSIDFEI